jgi:hypothetical protein
MVRGEYNGMGKLMMVNQNKKSFRGKGFFNGFYFG